MFLNGAKERAFPEDYLGGGQSDVLGSEGVETINPLSSFPLPLVFRVTG